ncbi:hypothetical protein D9M72_484520 [compost metagenome]
MRHVAGVVGDVGCVSQLPQGGDGDGPHEAHPVEVALLQEAGWQAVDHEDPAEGQQQGQTGCDAQDACIRVDEPVAENRGDNADNADDDDARVNADARADCGHCFATEHEVCGEEADVHDHHDDHDQQCTEGAELAARLDHLCHAQLRALGGVQRHEDAAHNVADDDAHDRRHKAEAEHCGGESAGHDGHDHDVGAEPDGEEVPSFAVAFVGRDGLNGLIFEPRYFCCRSVSGVHDAVHVAS